MACKVLGLALPLYVYVLSAPGAYPAKIWFALPDLEVLKHSVPREADSAPPVYLFVDLRYGNLILHKGCSSYKQLIFGTIVKFAMLLLLLELDYHYDVI